MFGFQPCFINTSNVAADSTISFAFGRSGQPQKNGPSDFNYNVTNINWHLMTNEGKYMSDEDAAYDSNPSTDGNKMGPAFKSLLGPLTRNRRLLLFSWNSFRSGDKDTNKSGVAGNFGLHKADLGFAGSIKSFQVGTCSSARSSDARDPDETKGKPEEEIPQGTLWNYESNNIFIKKNGYDYPVNPTIAIGTPSDPSIMDDSYTYGNEKANQLGVKYAKIRPGLDYIRNYQSNRFLYG